MPNRRYTKYSQKHKWPVITKNTGPLPEAEEYHPDNFPDGKEHLFDPTPGKGDD